MSCHHRFTTYENLEPVKFSVAKKNGTTEPYDRSKIIRGMKLATEKLNISNEKLEQIADRIEQKLLQLNKSVIPSTKIGDLVVLELRKLDAVAYLRFKSVYKGFKDCRSFAKEAIKLQKTSN